MKPSYQGNAKPYVLALFHETDGPQVTPVLEELEQRGLTICYPKNLRHPKSVIRRTCTVIAFLSAQSVNDHLFERALLFAKALEVPLVSVKLDHTPLQDSVNNLLFASNMIFADRYATPPLLADRILTAESLMHPKLTKAQIEAARLMALLLIAGTIVILAAAGFFIYQRISAAQQAQSQQAEPPDIAGLLSSGMTEEDLLNIRTLILVGDNMINPYKLRYYRDWSEAVSKMEIDGETVWSIDGKQIPRGTAKDISLIGRMSNLQDLILLNQSVTDLSPIQSLKNLAYVEIVDCPVDSIAALSGMSVLRGITLEQTQVTSFKPLESSMSLERIILDAAHCTSLDGLGIPTLKELELTGASELSNLNSLSACSGLERLIIRNAAKLKDISGLAGCTSLSKLEINDATVLSRCDSLSNLTGLTEVSLQNCGISDLSPLKNSSGLQRLGLQDTPVQSLDWTSGMSQLHWVHMHGTRIHSMNFLKNLDVDAMELHFSGDFDDYSGLAAIPYYSNMHLNPMNRNLDAVLPFIVNSKFSQLELFDCNGIDFAKLPQEINVLRITNGSLSSLEGIDVLPSMNTLELQGVNRLSSLKGLEVCKELTRITVQSCMRLTDYDAIYEKPYAMLKFDDLPTPPDLSRLQILGMGTLELNSMPSIRDISPLTGIKNPISSLTLVNLTALTDISALRHMQVNELIVSPQLSAQAKQLNDEEIISSYEVVYPQNELWAQNEGDFKLLSLTEIKTLPSSLLERVNDLTVVGDCVLDTETQEWTDEWKDNEEFFYTVDRTSGEMKPVGQGAISEIGDLSKLRNLQYLRLFDQPLTSLQGIQSMTDLRSIEVRKCPLTDAAAVFTLTRLERLSLFNTRVTSIQGIQNLSKLIQIDLNGTLVEDLSPLKVCDFSNAMENGGLELQIGFTSCQELSPLASIPGFAYLNIEGHDAATWLQYLAGKQVISLDANHCDITNEQIALLAALPGLKELQVCWNEKVTDLSPLLSCPTLEKVVVNSYSKEAIASIEGKARFTIEYRD